ncbi:MAG: molybdenum cofactor guanylyltransferase [Caulobacteraceae bacterium]|nr:molybdenum cofactor guanylyltransferase [Caulobacteraceae bacterium]
MSDPRLRLGGLVLAGGRSRRFGAEKALQPVAGRSMLERALALLDGPCEAVAVSARAGSGAAALAHARGLAVLHDAPDHPEGPLAGVAAGLDWASARGLDGLVTLPCDTPFLGPSEIARLIGALGDRPAAYAVTADGAQALVAIWTVPLARPLGSALAIGHPPVRDALDRLDACPVLFPDARPFLNVNRPGDLDPA